MKTREIQPAPKLLVISQHYWPESFRINSVVRDLRKAGCDVAVLTGQPNYPQGRIFDGHAWWRCGRTDHPDGYPVYRVPLIPRGSGRGRAVMLALNYLSFIVFGMILAPLLLRRRRIDTIFIYGTSPILQALVGVWLKWLRSARLVLWVQDLWPDSLVATGFVSNPRILSLVSSVVGFIYRRCDLILSQSRSLINPIARTAGATPVVYHPNPGDEDLVPEATFALTFDRPFTAVFAGNLGVAQALPAIVGAAEILRTRKDIGIVLVGSGARDEWLRDQIQMRGLDNIRLAGRYPPEAMPGIYQQASVLLVTLVADDAISRVIPSKLQSYMAAGVPVVAAINGEGARIVEEAGAGVTCRAEDPDALAQALLAVYGKSRDERRRMGLAGRAYYEKNFSPLVLTEALISHLR